MSNSRKVLSQLSDLSAAADDIITEDVPNESRIDEWCDIVKNVAENSIVEDPTESSSSNDSAELPTLNVFLTGKEPGRAPRVSTVLNKKTREKLHQKKGRSSTLRKSSIKTPKNIRQLFPDLNQNASTSSSTVETKVEAPYKKGMTLRSDASKRKSPINLSENTGKKTEMVERQKDKKIEKLPKAISSIQSPVGSVLKEQRILRSKMAINQGKAAVNSKKLMPPPPLRQQKKLNKSAIEKENPPKEGVKLRSGAGGPTTKKVPAKEATSKAKKINEKTLRGQKIGPSYNPQAQSLKKVYKTTEKSKKALSKQVASTSKAEKPLSEPVAGTSKTERPLFEPVASTSKTEKGPVSYPITPPRSSFVSYDISEINSDSDEEEETSNDKAVPSWATGVRLRNKLLQFHQEPIDTDELFGNQFEPVNLEEIMGVTKRAYRKRTSSAIWNTSILP